MSKDFSQISSYILKKDKSLSEQAVRSVLTLREEGAEAPFIAYYRKDKTGNLSIDQVSLIFECAEEWSEIVKRKASIIESIEKQEKLTPDLKKNIFVCETLEELEELYRPFKRKNQLKAHKAQWAGLGSFADWILALGQGENKEDTSLEVKAKEFLNSEAGFVTYDKVLSGVQHIIVQQLCNVSELRACVREDYFDKGVLTCSGGKKLQTKSKFSAYTDYKVSVQKLRSSQNIHRYSMIRKGWQKHEHCGFHFR